MLNETSMRVFTGPLADFLAANRVLFANELYIDENGRLRMGDGVDATPTTVHGGSSLSYRKTA